MILKLAISVEDSACQSLKSRVERLVECAEAFEDWYEGEWIPFEAKAWRDMEKTPAQFVAFYNVLKDYLRALGEEEAVLDHMDSLKRLNFHAEDEYEKGGLWAKAYEKAMTYAQSGQFIKASEAYATMFTLNDVSIDS